MKNFTKLFLVLFFMTNVLISVSCHFNKTFINREKDKIEAEKVTNLFYETVPKGIINNSTYEMYGSKFWEAEDTISFRADFKRIYDNFGALIEVKLDHWETIVVEGSNPKSEYRLYYLNQYENYKTKETFILEKENGKIKIVNYDLNQIVFE